MPSKCTGLNASALMKKVRKYNRFLKTTFFKLAGKQSQCLELCLFHDFDSCSEHDATIAELTLTYNVHGSLTQHIESLSNEDSSEANLKKRLEAICFAPNFKVYITSLYRRI